MKISRPAVKQYITEIERAGFTYAAIEQMPDDTLWDILSGERKTISDRYKALSSQFEYYCKELERTSVTLQLLWKEYRRKHPDGYHYSQFCTIFRYGAVPLVPRLLRMSENRLTPNGAAVFAATPGVSH